jgi:uncharacterized membrane protein
MIGLPILYGLTGFMFAGFTLGHLRQRAWRSAVFWGLFTVLLAGGSWLPDIVSGCMVLAMAVLAAIGLKPAPVESVSTQRREASAGRLGNRLFLPALAVPMVTVAGTLLLPLLHIDGRPVVDPAQVTLVALACGAIIGLAWAIVLLGASPIQGVQEGRRLMDGIGWAAVLPQSLAGLGAIFAAAGVGKVVASLITAYVPVTTPLAAVMLYACGMALFTAIMGNAFAAFPLMTAGIGLPLVVGRFGGNPAAVCAIGMLSGFCGTLVTPMAANFNIVPAAVLELADRNGVIKVQAPTAIILLGVNIVLMLLLAFPWPR